MASDDATVERIARAICRQFIIGAFKPYDPPQDEPQPGSCGMNQHVEEGWRDWREHARAALDALPARGEAPIQLTMQDIRLHVGEGRLTQKDILAGVNAALRSTKFTRPARAAPPSPLDPASIRAEAMEEAANIAYEKSAEHGGGNSEWHLADAIGSAIRAAASATGGQK